MPLSKAAARKRAEEKAQKRREHAIKHKAQLVQQSNKILPREYNVAIKNLTEVTSVYYCENPEGSSFVRGIMTVILALWNLACNRELWVKKVLSAATWQDTDTCDPKNLDSYKEWNNEILPRIKCHSDCYERANPYNGLVISFEHQCAELISRQGDIYEQITHMKQVRTDTFAEICRILDKLRRFDHARDVLKHYVEKCRFFSDNYQPDEKCDQQELSKKLAGVASGLVEYDISDDDLKPTDQFDFGTLNSLVRDCEKLVENHADSLRDWGDYALGNTIDVAYSRANLFESCIWLVKEFGSVENARSICDMLWSKKYGLDREIKRCEEVLNRREFYEKVNVLVQKMKNSVNKPHDFLVAFIEHITLLKEDYKCRTRKHYQQEHLDSDDCW